MMTCILSCSKKEEIEEAFELATKVEYGKYLEYLDDSFPDLPWLKEIIEKYRSIFETGSFLHVTIHQCTYKDGIGFLLNDCVQCKDYGFGLLNIKGEFVCSDGGWVGSCREYVVDYANKKLIWEIQPDPPLTIENLHEQPLDVINKCVQGKWILHKLWDESRNHFYDWTTFVYISENSVAISGNEGINLNFSYRWKKMEVSPPYSNMEPYTTYVMWNDKQNRGEWSFFSISADMLYVNLFNYRVYTLIRVRDVE